MIDTDFIVIGAGIAGVSLAYELAESASVVVLERELHAGYHSTGRSAALFSEIYGNATIRALSRASREFLLSPDPAFCDSRLLQPRGVLYIGTAQQRNAVQALREAPDVSDHLEDLSTQQALALVPVLRPEYAVHCLYEPAAMDIEAATLHQSYIKGLRRRGGRIVMNCEISTIERSAERWSVHAREESFRAPVLVDAAGAWADSLAELARVHPIGLEPRRRTALLIRSPSDGIEHWPMVIDIDESFYFKPDAGKLLLSPADESPCSPCDAQPEELDVAIAVDRVEQATTLTIRHVTHQWAGLRTFAADRSPVVGYDPTHEGFFWLAGQGGYGIQTAPALSRVAAALAMHRPIPPDIQDQGVELHALSPDRLRGSA